MAQENTTPGGKRLTADAFKLDLYFWLQALVTGLVALIFMFTFIGRAIAVDGSSMLPTLRDGDMIVLRSIGYAPKPGDVVVVTQPTFSDTSIVKRVIAVEGQRVQIDYDAGTVTVDGVILTEPYINEPMRQPWEQGVTETVVPEGSIFVMGDNRNNSRDSRHANIGFIDTDYIIGQAIFILFPLAALGPIK